MEHGTQVHFSTVHDQPQQQRSNANTDLDTFADHVIEEQEQAQEQQPQPRSISKSKSSGPSTPNLGGSGTLPTFSPHTPARWLGGLMGTRNANANTNTNTMDQGEELGEDFKKKTSFGGGGRKSLSRSGSQKRIDAVRSPPLRDASGNIVVAQPASDHGAAAEAKSLGISLEAKSFQALLSPNTKKKRTQVNSADHYEPPAPQPHNPLASAAPAVPTKPGMSSSKKNLAKDLGNDTNTNAAAATTPTMSARMVNLTSKRSLKDVVAGIDEQQQSSQTTLPGERDSRANSTSFGRSKSEKNLGERTSSMKKGLEKLISNLGVTMDNGPEGFTNIDEDQFVIESSFDGMEKKQSMGKRSSSINIPSKKQSTLNMTTGDFQHNLSKRASSMHLTFDQTYEMKEQIGRGGQSLIFAAIRVKDGKKVAIKRISKLRRPEETDKDLAKRMEYARIEAEVWATVCDHKNIVELLDLMEDEENIYMVMEYIDGRQMLQSVSTLQFNEAEALIILRQVAAAVAYLHSFNIAHRDVKFENIMFTSMNPSSNSFDLKLIDFGLVHSATHRKTEESSATAGTFMWMSPEQISGIPHPAMSVDVWSMGVLLFTLVEMRYPFYAKTMEELEANICKASLTKEIHRATSDVKELLLDMLTHDFNNRPKADEIVARLDKMLAARNVKTKFETVKSKKGGGLLGNMF